MQTKTTKSEEGFHISCGDVVRQEWLVVLVELYQRFLPIRCQLLAVVRPCEIQDVEHVQYTPMLKAAKTIFKVMVLMMRSVTVRRSSSSVDWEYPRSAMLRNTPPVWMTSACFSPGFFCRDTKSRQHTSNASTASPIVRLSSSKLRS